MRHYILCGHQLPAAKLPARLRQSSENERAVHFVKSANYAGKKRGEEVVAGARAFHGANDDSFQSPDFEFDVEESVGMIAVQYIFEAGRDFVRTHTALLNSLERRAAQRQTVEFGIVTKNGVVIASAADVELEAIGAVLQSEVKSCERVFRRVASRASMPEKEEFA